MEQFFTPTRRIQDWYDSIREPLAYAEVRLAVSIKALMNHSWDWLDLYESLNGDEDVMWKILWITKGTLLYFEDENNAPVESDEFDELVLQKAYFTAPSGETHRLVLAKGMVSPSLPAAVSSIFWHAVLTSSCVKLRLQGSRLCSGLALSQFLEASPSLELLEFKYFDFEEAHCRAFQAMERTGLEVSFQECSFDGQGAKDTFIELLRHSQLVTKLENCRMERIMYSALTGNSSVKSLSMYLSITASTNDESDSHIRSLARALEGSLGMKICACRG
jgi:hypothetical protein